MAFRSDGQVAIGGDEGFLAIDYAGDGVGAGQGQTVHRGERRLKTISRIGDGRHSLDRDTAAGRFRLSQCGVGDRQRASALVAVRLEVGPRAVDEGEFIIACRGEDDLTQFGRGSVLNRSDGRIDVRTVQRQLLRGRDGRLRGVDVAAGKRCRLGNRQRCVLIPVGVLHQLQSGPGQPCRIEDDVLAQQAGPGERLIAALERQRLGGLNSVAIQFVAGTGKSQIAVDRQHRVTTAHRGIDRNVVV